MVKEPIYTKHHYTLTYVEVILMKVIKTGEVRPDITMGGVCRCLISSETVGAKNILVGVCRYEPGESCASHIHEKEEEVVFIINGRCVYREGKERKELSAGTAIYTPPGVEHAIEEIKEPLWLIYVFSPPVKIER